MKILLTNDDGIYAPGLAAMERALRRLGDVYVVAPSREQSGVSHSITFLTPLMVKKVFVDDRHWGWTVDGSPADCVKLGATQIMPEIPDLVVSGINGGLNAGINILYSGTVGAAVEGAFFGITSFAVSLEYDENEPFHRAADLATDIIKKVLDKDPDRGNLYNLNIPLAALRDANPKLTVAEMDASQYWESFEKRTDPLGRTYYWLTGRPDPRQLKTSSTVRKTDLQTLIQGSISLTPLDYNLTKHAQLASMEGWNLRPDPVSTDSALPETDGPSIRMTAGK